jgi:lysophospholipase L1-like esterase
VDRKHSIVWLVATCIAGCSTAAPAKPAPSKDAPVRDPRGLDALRFEPTPMPEGLGLSVGFEDPSGRALTRFHAALARAAGGHGQARIAVWGASHTAADHWPGYLRDAFQRRFGDAGRGFTLIAWPSDRYDYWQWGVEVAPGAGWARSRLHRTHGVPEQYGLAGLAFDSEGRAARAEVRTSDWGIGRRASEVTLFYLAQPGGGDIDVRIDDEHITTIATHAEEMATGIRRFEVDDDGHRVSISTPAGAPVRIYGLALERSVPGVIVDNFGLSGARLRNHLKWLDPTYRDLIRQRDPDLLVLAYGGNEGNDLRDPIARFRDEAFAALTRLRALTPEASCLLIGPADKPLRRGEEWIHRPRTSHVAEALRTLAAEVGCAFFDTVAFMGGPLSIVRWVRATPPLARDDHVHFSAVGYRRLGEVLYESLVDGFYVEAPAR